VKQQIKEKLGFNPYPGTLNLRLDEENVKLKVSLEKEAKLRLCHSEGYCTGLLFKAFIGGLACGVVIPQVEDYPDEELEIVADENLRKNLHFHDGDTVRVSVFL
jgi:riboflavin kinase